LSNQKVAYCCVLGRRHAAPMHRFASTTPVVDGTAGLAVSAKSGANPAVIACVTPFVVVVGVTSTIAAFVMSVPPSRK
jgi:hypothetical protein